MTKPLPFTQAGIRRAILAAQSAGLHVIGIQPDGTVLTSSTPLALSIQAKHNDPTSQWDDKPAPQYRG